MKVCSKCGIEKDEGEFHKDKTKKEGLSTHCKKCRKEKDKKYKEINSLVKNHVVSVCLANEYFKLLGVL